VRIEYARLERRGGNQRICETQKKRQSERGKAVRPSEIKHLLYLPSQRLNRVKEGENQELIRRKEGRSRVLIFYSERIRREYRGREGNSSMA